MGPYYYSLFILFTVIAVMVVIDQNVGDYIILLTKIIKLNFERFIWMIRFHPQNPIGRYLLWKKSLKMAEEMQKEFMQRTENEVSTED